MGEALRQAKVNLTAIPAPAGTFDVVLGAGWPGVMLHEAVGPWSRRRLQSQGNISICRTDWRASRRPKGVTVVDDGTLSERRGSLSIDDEGTPTQYTTLIEDGILVGYMQDRQNARLMGMADTGNGRRQSLCPYSHAPHDQHLYAGWRT